MSATGQRILVVDDNPSVASLLEHALVREGYRVQTVDNGIEALARVAHDPPDLIFLDLDLPALPGDEVCRRLKNSPDTRTIPIVMITGSGEPDSRLAAWDYGADEFLPKPFRMAEITSRCRSLLRIKRLIDERDSAEAVVFALARAVEAKSPFTHGHAERVTGYCLQLAERVGLTEREREILRKGSLLHDVGKISIPDSVLDKPGPLTATEYALIKTHPAQGAHIIEPLHSLNEAIPLIRWHHERLDGKGYPDGLAGDEIPLLVRILSVCDVYDSLASDRPYRKPMPAEVCMELLHENAADGGLDPELVKLFTQLLPKLPRRTSSPTFLPAIVAC